MVATMGIYEILMLLMSGGSLTGGLLGIPPGERDANLIRCAPRQSVVYVEWSERSAGERGGQGIDGLAGDIEIREFLARIDSAIRTAIERETENGNETTQVLARAVPPLVHALLVRPGCLFVAHDPERTAQLQPEDAPPNPVAVIGGLNIGIVINGGDRSDDIAGSLTALLNLLPEPLRAEGLERRSLPVPVPGAPLMFHQHENHFIIAFGAGTLDSILSGLAGDGNGLGDNERFTSAFQKIAIDRTAGVTWLDVKMILDTVVSTLGPGGDSIRHVVSTLGLDGVDSLTATAGVIDGQIVSRSLLSTDGKTEGLLSFVGGRGLTGDDFRHVPADADFACGVSVNLPDGLKAIRAILGALQPAAGDDLNSAIETADTALGLSIEQDLLPALGNAWTIYDSPSAGGYLLTSGVAAVEVRDPQQAYSAFTQAMTLLSDQLPGISEDGRRRGTELRKEKFLDRTVYYMNTVGDDFAIAPTFCVTDSHVLASLHPQAMKAHLRFVNHPWGEFAERFPQTDGDVVSWSHCDSQRLVRVAYAAIPFLAQVFFSEVQRDGANIDVFSFPSSRAILRYLNDASSRTVRTPDGILCESRTSLPIPGGSFITLVVPFVGGAWVAPPAIITPF